MSTYWSEGEGTIVLHSGPVLNLVLSPCIQTRVMGLLILKPGLSRSSRLPHVCPESWRVGAHRLEPCKDEREATGQPAVIRVLESANQEAASRFRATKRNHNSFPTITRATSHHIAYQSRSNGYSGKPEGRGRWDRCRPHRAI